MLGVKGFCEIGGMVNSQTTTGVMNGATTKMVAEAESQRMIELARFAGQIVQIGGWRVDLDPFQVHWTPETAAIHERPDLLLPSFDECGVSMRPSIAIPCNWPFNPASAKEWADSKFKCNG